MCAPACMGLCTWTDASAQVHVYPCLYRHIVELYSLLFRFNTIYLCLFFYIHMIMHACHTCTLYVQVQRIYEYHRLLVQLFTMTSKDHPDYEDLRHTVARVQHVSHMTST